MNLHFKHFLKQNRTFNSNFLTSNQDFTVMIIHFSAHTLTKPLDLYV